MIGFAVRPIAGVFIAPSHQKNLPTAVMESMACGTPAVAFNAAPYDSEDLARGIARVLETPARTRALGAVARDRVEREFALKDVVGRYVRLCEDLVQ